MTVVLIVAGSVIAGLCLIAFIVWANQYTKAGPNETTADVLFLNKSPWPVKSVKVTVITAANAGVVPPSPPERTPSLLVGVGTSLSAVERNGNLSARGIA